MWREGQKAKEKQGVAEIEGKIGWNTNFLEKYVRAVEA